MSFAARHRRLEAQKFKKVVTKAMAKKIGKRRTGQRDAILKSLLDASRPLTVKEIHELSSEKIDSLGIATVYRTVKLLINDGLILSVLLPDGETRYESSNLGHHHHFKCTACEKVFDLPHCPISIPTGTTLPNGFSVNHHEVILYGSCDLCCVKTS